ncbi:hypothetical protein NFI96_007823 [Prochilodus magdalenae]|nr:hypothetical protein NFI96_007823 [Prochilodus magdalenae]
MERARESAVWSELQRVMGARINHNERLEFLGDAVVEFLTSVHLYYLFPSLEEGGLATYRTAIVQNQHLAMLAKRLQVKAVVKSFGRCFDRELGSARPLGVEHAVSGVKLVPPVIAQAGLRDVVSVDLDVVMITGHRNLNTTRISGLVNEKPGPPQTGTALSLATNPVQSNIVLEPTFPNRQWQQVIFSDEFSFSLGGDDQRIRVWEKLELDRFMLYAHGPDLCRESDLRHAMANCFEALIGMVVRVELYLKREGLERCRSVTEMQERHRDAGASQRCRSVTEMQGRDRDAGASQRCRSVTEMQERHRDAGASQRCRSVTEMQGRDRDAGT